MKHLQRKSLVLLLSVLSAVKPVIPQAVGSVDRSVIAGGGGSSTGGSISIHGTVGEVSAAHPMSGGSLTLTGGFWNTLDGSSAATQLQFSASNINLM